MRKSKNLHGFLMGKSLTCSCSYHSRSVRIFTAARHESYAHFLTGFVLTPVGGFVLVPVLSAAVNRPRDKELQPRAALLRAPRGDAVAVAVGQGNGRVHRARLRRQPRHRLWFSKILTDLS
jgi:hypothetical protein